MLLQFLKDVFAFDANSPLLFTQFYFWAFFAFVMMGLSLLQNRVLMRNAFLFFVSLFFYYKTSGLFVLILIFTTIFCFSIAKAIYSSRREWTKKLYLIIGLVVCLLMLCYFKYAYLFAHIVNSIFGTEMQIIDVFSWVGNELTGSSRFDVSRILLPIGISFYTFQSISYLVDVYRAKVKPVTNILDFGFFVSFFPQVVSGPIVRASTFVPQIYKKFFLSRRQFGIAVFWILNGLAKKIILSDYIAVNFVDRIFDNPTMYSGFENLVALFGYSVQVYADFSGYTDIAIGVAMLMGFYLPKNFNSPYKATDPGNFWKRWHMSLSKWLQDYLYIPLGGSRNATFGSYFCITAIALIAIILSGSLWLALIIAALAVILLLVGYFRPERRQKINTNINLSNTMLLGGLWHGASVNFMIWGGLNGLAIIIYKYWRNLDVLRRTAVLFLFTLLFGALSVIFPAPIFNIGFLWVGIIFAGTLIRLIYNLLGGAKPFQWLETSWAVLQTFVFISWTRLFFRSGSNLDPAEANESAWNTARNMVTQIGGKWSTAQIPDMIYAYRYVFALIVLGMIIHWLPENFKRRYRIMFSSMPLPVMLVVVVACVFIVYQFVTADLQKFIYFQF